MVGVWVGLNLGSIPNFFQCFGMHPKIIDDPKLIQKGGVVHFCLFFKTMKDFTVLQNLTNLQIECCKYLKHSAGPASADTLSHCHTVDCKLF